VRFTNRFGVTTDHAEVNPTVQDTGFVYNWVTQTLTWTKGNGEQSLVVASKREIVFFPLDGVTYSKNDDNPLFKVVYRGNGTSANVADQDLSEGLYFYVCAFDGVQSTEKYYRRGIPFIFVPPPSDEWSILFEDGTTTIGLEDGSGNILTENQP